jgi:manganese/zinc/iron transport system ATP- binding protein
MSDEKYIIEVEDMTVAYQVKPVLWDVDLKVPKGILMAIVGPNGAGKSTLIKAMLDLIKPISGSVLFNGDTYENQRKTLATYLKGVALIGISPQLY